jgi:hypothetical protein
MIIHNRTTARFIFLTTSTLIIEMIGLPQPFTGPLVNMMLILTALLINPLAGVGLGLITPMAAALRGQLPPPLIPMAPFIIVANGLLVVGFSAVRRLLRRFEPRGSLLRSLPAWTGLLIGAALKWGFLYFSAQFFLPLLLAKLLPDKVIALMSLPQFITALIGGGAALVLYQLLKRRLYIAD